MPNTSDIAVYLYRLDGAGAATEYGSQVFDLSFSTLAPGGFGDLSGKIAVSTWATIPPQLRQFANVSLWCAGKTVWSGRLQQPTIGFDQQMSDYVAIQAQGGAIALKDDPENSSYALNSAKSIITTEISNRSAYIQIDQDTSAILPDNPTVLFAPGFNGKDIEQILNEITAQLGDYIWTVYDHANHRDAAGFATWQLNWHQRDTTTVSYQADESDILDIKVDPVVDLFYNAVQLDYRSITTNIPGSVTVQDSRLNANKSQGSAPFPYRKLYKDMGSKLLSASAASTIANALLGLYQNGGYVVKLTLASVRDANGNAIPLAHVRADSNIQINCLAPVVQAQLPTAATPNSNLWYVKETRYNESGGQMPTLAITTGNWDTRADVQVAMMQVIAERQAKDTKVYVPVQGAGSTEPGWCGGRAIALNSGIASATATFHVNYKTVLVGTPTSIVLTTSTSNNFSGINTSSPDPRGFILSFTWSPAAGDAWWYGTYQVNY